MNNLTANKKYAVLFYTIFTLLNIIQAYSTQLIDDEAYYWVYSKFLDWGYYDHPPMIAIFIKIGYTFFHNELGVRLLMVSVSSLSIFLLEKIIEPANKKLFYAIVLNIAALQFAGFIAVPDIPLLFFVIVYFYRYKKYLLNPNLLNTIFWGVSMALMLYTKYHGILIIFFTLLSNVRLLKKWQVYIAGIVGAAMFLPHLIWEFNHGFPSVYYHLWDRNSSAYKIEFTSEYLFGQIALAGPILGWLFVSALVLFRSSDPFKKALQFSAVGFYLFFLLSSFRGRIEANWTIPALSSIAAIAYYYFSERKKWHRLIYISAVISFLLVCFIRVILITGIIDLPVPIVYETKGNKEWATAIKAVAKEKSVVFLNSYQSPSKYWFYSGDTGFSINTAAYRQNNFNIWNISKDLQGKDIVLVTSERRDSTDIDIATTKGALIIHTERAVSFETNALLYMQRKIILKNNQPVALKGKLYGSDKEHLLKDKIFLQITDNKNFTTEVQCTDIQFTDSGCTVFFAPSQLLTGKYSGKICIRTSVKNISSLNSNIISITVEQD